MALVAGAGAHRVPRLRAHPRLRRPDARHATLWPLVPVLRRERARDHLRGRRHRDREGARARTRRRRQGRGASEGGQDCGVRVGRAVHQLGGTLVRGLDVRVGRGERAGVAVLADDEVHTSMDVSTFVVVLPQDAHKSFSSDSTLETRL